MSIGPKFIKVMSSPFKADSTDRRVTALIFRICRDIQLPSFTIASLDAWSNAQKSPFIVLKPAVTLNSMKSEALLTTS